MGSRPGYAFISKGKPVRARYTLAQVIEIASKQKPSNNRGNPATVSQIHDGSPLWGQPIPKGRQCGYIHPSGKQCGRWAMKKARRCWCHGGLLDNPHHPSARKALPILEQRKAAKDAWRELRATTRQETRRAVEEALLHKGAALSPSAILEGCNALETDDNGRAWRRFLGNITTPTAEQRSRRSGRKKT